MKNSIRELQNIVIWNIDINYDGKFQLSRNIPLNELKSLYIVFLQNINVF